MLEHAIMNGWDQEVGGFYQSGAYLDASDHCTILSNSKMWWAQAEALNALLLFSQIFPHDTLYRELFEKQWDYVDTYLLDHHNGDWYEGGLDKDPHFISGPKSHMWKCTYHTGRMFMNCIALLSEERHATPGMVRRKNELENLIEHWKKT
jgi:mannobiose 2-epimerase